MSMFSSIAIESAMEKLKRFIESNRNLDESEQLRLLEKEIDDVYKSAKAGYE